MCAHQVYDDNLPTKDETLIVACSRLTPSTAETKQRFVRPQASIQIDETGPSAHFERIALRISNTAPPTRPPISSPKAPLAIFCDLLVFQAKSAYGTKN